MMAQGQPQGRKDFEGDHELCCGTPWGHRGRGCPCRAGSRWQEFSSVGGCGHRESRQEVNHPALCQHLVWACLVLGGICFILHSAVPWRAETFAEG